MTGAAPGAGTKRERDQLPEIPEADRVDRILDGWLVSDALAGLSAEHRAVVIHSYYLRETTPRSRKIFNWPRER